MRDGRGRRRLLRSAAGFSAFAVILAALGFLWLRTSLPILDGRIALPGLSAPVLMTRDARGYLTLQAENDRDAYRALGFAHAQDRLFQMDLMRRAGTGRLSEILGRPGFATDRLMRLLGLYDQAERQFAEADPDLRAALIAYSEGVNAYIEGHRGAWPPEFLILNYRPEPWRPADSLVWGRLMALQLSGNWREEEELAAMRARIAPWLFDLVTGRTTTRANRDAGFFGPDRDASNNWAIGGAFSRSGAPLLANDPHLGLGLPATWYLARIEVPGQIRFGATAPGLPFIIIGSNRDVAWGFTTTHSDTQDLFVESPDPGRTDFYRTPSGPLPFRVKKTIIKVRGESDNEVLLRWSRHGPIVSDLSSRPGPILALSWTALAEGDRTPAALLAMNAAKDAAEFRRALMDFHAPQQNIVFADRQGAIGFVAAGRAPVRRAIFAESRLPAPGEDSAYDWVGFLPFADLPQIAAGESSVIVTANNDIRPAHYPHFLTGAWPPADRAKRIAAAIDKAKERGKLDLADLAQIQRDTFSRPLHDLIRAWQPVAEKSDPQLASLLADWDGHVDRDQSAPLIATLWGDRMARALLADEPGFDFDRWWRWQWDVLAALIADGRACKDHQSPGAEGCEALLARSLAQTRADLQAALGPDPANWTWGAAHRAPFAHPIFSRLPLIGDWSLADLATPGDDSSVNRGTAEPPGAGIALRHNHGPGLRFLIDLADPDSALFALAGGQSGNPFSSYYADGLADWRDGHYRSMLSPKAHTISLIPEERKASAAP